MLLGVTVAETRAVVISVPSSTGSNLYETYNSFFATNAANPSNERYERFAEENDPLWAALSGTGYASVAMRHAGYGQALGTRTEGGGYQRIVSAIAPGGNALIPLLTFQTGAAYSWVETYASPATPGSWDSQAASNAEGLDRFIALRNPFSDQHPYTRLIAFEDLSLDDRDFNDLVAIVHRVLPEKNPIPEPASMLLLGIGLVSFAAFSRRCLKKPGEPNALPPEA